MSKGKSKPNYKIYVYGHRQDNDKTKMSMDKGKLKNNI